MKKYITAGILFGVLMPVAYACNICGMASGGNYLGILPQYEKHFVGLRYQYRGFTSTHPPSLIPGLSGRVSHENYHTAEWFGRLCPGKRWQILGMAQYQILRQQINGETTQKSGLGDASVLAYYSLLPGKSREGRKTTHLLQTGGGVKLPAGAFSGPDENGEYNAAFQPGTGSTDKVIMAIYTLRRNNAGLNSEWSYSLNGTNKFGYRFGHRFTSGIRYFRTYKKCSSIWMWHTGFGMEAAGADRWRNSIQQHTGGMQLTSLSGIDRFSENWAFGISFRTPVWQQLSGGYLKSNGRLLLSVSKLF